MRKYLVSTLAGLAIVAAGSISSAHAGGISVGIAFGVPFPASVVYAPAPEYYREPAYYSPPPVYYAPREVYAPPPAYYAPRAVYAPPPAYYAPRAVYGPPVYYSPRAAYSRPYRGHHGHDNYKDNYNYNDNYNDNGYRRNHWR